jgi:hypothetical protein
MTLMTTTLNCQYIMLCAFLINACTAHLEPTAINARYTPSEARKYVNWWSDNIRPSQRAVFQDALAGDHTALRRILMDADNSFGPPDQDGEPASSLSTVFLVALGDVAFAEFISNESDAVKNTVFGSFGSSPWSLTYDYYTAPADAESRFSKIFPRTARIRSQFYKGNS